MARPESKNPPQSRHYSFQSQKPATLIRYRCRPGAAPVKALDSLRAFKQHTRKRRQVWDTVPRKSRFIFLGMVFCLFAGIGALSQFEASTASLPKLWTAALITGIFATGFAWTAIETHWLFIFPLVGLQALVNWWMLSYVGRHSAPGPAISDAIKPWLDTGTTATTLLIAGAYAMAMTFIFREGDRFFRTHTEMRLAGEIHKLLVPTIQRTNGKYEFYGTSLASGVVGGDLVDVIERDGHWLAYVVDVAGHGVSSGVLMAMIKSSANMSMRFDSSGDALLQGLNEVLCSLKTGNMFATFGFLAYSPGRGLRYSLAGHLPILQCRRGEIQFLPAQNVPIGLFSDMAFESTPIHALPGDVFAIVTDGLTEIFDKQGRELGIGAIAAVLRDVAERPLSEIAAAIFQHASQHGVRSDDQSLLLVRKAA